MAVNSCVTNETSKLRARKRMMIETETPALRKGTFVWGKFNNSHWPGIILTHEDVQLSERKGHYILFWFGDHRISHVPYSGVEHFAENFKKYYKQKHVALWKDAIVESVMHYGYPLTAGLTYDSLINFAKSDEILKIDSASYQEDDIPEFVKITVSSRELYRKEQLDKTKRLNKIKYILPHVINDTCIACLDTLTDDGVPHPLFDANVCVLCARKLREVLFLFENDNNGYCFICGNSKNFQCGNSVCEAAFCNFCIKTYFKFKVNNSTKFCNICSPMLQGLLKLSENYMRKLCVFMLSDETKLTENAITPMKLAHIDIRFQFYINVLTLYHGVSTGIETVFPFPYNVLLALLCNNLSVNTDLAKRSSNLYQVNRRLKKYLNNKVVRLASLSTTAPIEKSVMNFHIEDLNYKKCKEIGSVFLIVGGTSLSRSKLKHFCQCSLTDLFIEFWRVIQIYEEDVDSNTKWLYEMPYTLDIEEISFITRCLDCEPQIIGSNEKYRYVWTNLSVK